MPGHDIVVIGASAGGVEALQQLVASVPSDYPGTLFVSLHMARETKSVLGAILDRSGPLPASTAKDGQAIRRGHIYVAPPDYHLVVRQDRLAVIRGPKEHGHRPSIDVMFRSASQAYGPRVVGVVLSGYRDDGTAGLSDIKKAGGVAIVQDPDEAAAPQMPLNAAERVPPDYVLRSSEIGRTLLQLANDPPLEERFMAPPHPDDAEFPKDEKMESNGRPSAFTCPACSGTLWELDDEGILRFRCRVGHAYSAETMFSAQVENVENSLYAALRVLEENMELARRLAKRARGSKNDMLAEKYEGQAAANEAHAQRLRTVLMSDAPRDTGDEVAKVPPHADDEHPFDNRNHRRGTMPRKKRAV